MTDSIMHTADAQLRLKRMPLMASDATLRDFFAAKALPALIPMDHEELEEFSGDFENSDSMDLITRLAYQIADAMLKARYA